MSNIRLLEGEVDDPYAQIAALKDELRDVRGALTAATREARQAREDGSRALTNLRRQLSPLYRALQDVFGELDAAGASDDVPPSAFGPGTATVDPRTAAVWASWKGRMGAAAPVIDALLLHGEMTTTQIGIAIQRSRKTVPALIFKLNRAGLINKNGNKFSLKSL